MWTMKDCQDRDALMKKVQEECAVDKERIEKRWADEECVRRNALSTRSAQDGTVKERTL